MLCLVSCLTKDTFPLLMSYMVSFKSLRFLCVRTLGRPTPTSLKRKFRKKLAHTRKWHITVWMSNHASSHLQLTQEQSVSSSFIEQNLPSCHVSTHGESAMSRWVTVPLTLCVSTQVCLWGKKGRWSTVEPLWELAFLRYTSRMQLSHPLKFVLWV